MKISIIIPSRNEAQAELEGTVRSFLDAGAAEVVVIDDGSTVPVAEIDGALLHREAQSIGAAGCRNYGALLATGDCLVWSDAHVRLSGDLDFFAGNAMAGQRIVAAACRNHERPERVAYGARLSVDTKYPGFRLNGTLERPASPLSPIPCLYGSVYAMSRETYSILGGWPRTLGWGYNEQALSLAAHTLGVELLCDAETVIDHKFRKAFPYHVDGWGPVANRIRLHRMLAEDASWRTWESRFQRLQAAWRRAFVDIELLETWRAFYQEHRRRTDAEVSAIVGVTL